VTVRPGADPRGEGPRTASVAFTPPDTHDAGAVRYQVSMDGGRHWRTLAVSGIPGTSRVRGVRPGVTYPVKVRVVVTVASGASTGQASAAVPVRLARGWYHDPLSPWVRRSLVPVPARPAAYSGPRARTQAIYRSHGGALVVPAAWARGPS
jgi:hypothetical protein